MIDFLILYEEKVRELESACLLKNQLEKIGYKVKIDLIYSFRKNFCNAKVLIMPHLYNDLQIYQFVSKFKKRRCIIINLQFEQVIRKIDSEKGYGIPTGDAVNSVVFCWGKHEANRYSPESKQRKYITGCLPMDFNLPKYDAVFLTRNQLFEKYGINPTKKTILFISSFMLADKNDDDITLLYGDNNDHIKIFSEISSKSKIKTIEYLNKISTEFDCNVIYRPHPAEYSDPQLLNITKINHNFFVISSDSIRQWIRASDYLVSWFSTSIIDAYFAEKKCIVLRPFNIPPDLDCPLYYGARSVTTYEEFVCEIEQPKEFPIRQDIINEYYANRVGEECIKSVVDACIEIYNDDKYIFTYEAKKTFTPLRQQIKTFFVEIFFELSRYFNLTWLYKIILRQNKAKRDFFIHVQKELYNLDNEINECCKRLSNV